VRVWEQAPDGHRMNLADPNLDDFRAQNNTLADLAAYSGQMSAVSDGDEPVRVNVSAVSTEFFKILGVKPVRGRPFAPDEQRVHGAPAALVSYKYWQRHLAAADDLTPFHVSMQGTSYPVIGVTPEGFDFPSGVDAWIPRELETKISNRRSHNWRGLGRLRDGVTIAQARANLSAIGHRLNAEYGKQVDLNDAAIVTLADATVGDVRTALLTLLGAVGLLLVVACANVAGLLVARTAARRKELAVRVALGAGRGRLIQQFLAESFSLSVIGGTLGILLAAWAVRALPVILPANLPRQHDVAVSVPVVLAAIAGILAVAVSLGLFAAWRATGSDPQEALGVGSRGYSGIGASQRLRGLLVIGEIAITLVILVGAGLLGRSFLRLISTSPGFNAQSLITMQFSVSSAQWQVAPDQSIVARQVHLAEDILTRLCAIPGAQAVALAGALPVAAGDNLVDGDFLILTGQRPPADLDEFLHLVQSRSQAGHADHCVVSEEYFRTLDIPLVRGRVFREQDDWNSPNVAVISEALARQRWPDRDPISQVIDFAGIDGNLKPLTIVGIVGDVRASGLDAPPPRIVYVDYRQRGINANASPTILMRSAAPLGATVSAARVIFHDLAPEAPVKFSTFAAEMGGWLADRRFLLFLVGVFAAAAMALAAVGIYGVVAFSVTRRTQEIGVRMALGAEARGVLRLVAGEGAKLAVVGVAIGIAASFAVTRLISSLLFGVSATDPITFVGVALLLCVVALLASYVPARRATRLDPTIALRHE